jgi:hypothetical protein
MQCELLTHLAELHTTELGVLRIQRNLGLDPATDVIAWCREKIKNAAASIIRRGKNWYISVDHIIITVNAFSYTVITAHKEKAKSG